MNQAAIQKRLDKLQQQITEASRALEGLQPSGMEYGTERLRHIGRQTTALGREAGQFACRHPTATSLAVLGIAAAAAVACVVLRDNNRH